MKNMMFTLAMAAGFATSAQAQDAQVAVGLGTLGLDVSASTRISPDFGLRGIVGYGRLSRNETLSGNPAEATLRTGGLALLGDWHPGGGNFRVSGGAFLSRYEASATSTGSVELNGDTYTATVNALIEAERSVSPMLTIGYESTPSASGWAISSEVGAILTGLSSLLDGTATGAINAEFQSDLAAERARLADEVGGISALPFVRLGVAYRF